MYSFKIGYLILNNRLDSKSTIGTYTSFHNFLNGLEYFRMGSTFHY